MRKPEPCRIRKVLRGAPRSPSPDRTILDDLSRFLDARTVLIDPSGDASEVDGRSRVGAAGWSIVSTPTPP
ncbi:MFS transporter, partial [Micromonospora sp. KC207]